MKIQKLFENFRSFINEDALGGGLADKSDEGDFDPVQVKKGKKVEAEHTNNPEQAKEIAMDHLKEDPKYYDKLKKMEKGECDGRED